MKKDMNCEFECEFKGACIDDCNLQCDNYQDCAACIQDGKYDNCVKIGKL